MDIRLRLLLGVVLLGGVTAGVLGTNAVALDGDNVTEADELRQGTDPFDADTDGDGVDDGAEIARGTDPLESDTDDDGLNDSVEATYGTDATVNDTDGDGLLDGKEVNDYETNPKDADSDDDGLDDSEEINEYDTDPNDADTDDDGLDDGDEISEGADPRDTDTDDDGLQDGEEIREGTDPTRADSDNDGLSDGEELEFGSDPTIIDTDNDGLDDAEEHELGTDPTNEDTDGDGLSDGDEVKVNALGDAEPLQKDVFIELDWMRGEKPSRDTIQDVVDVFDDAPVKNPDGTTGINLHVEYSEEVEYKQEATPGTVFEILRKNMEYEHCGYYYALAIDRTDRDDTIAYTLSNHKNKPIAFKTDAKSGYYYRDGAIRNAFMHEIGHVLGISNDDYHGVDSRTVDYDAYPSVMNYNSPAASLEFNTGKPFDDWEHMVENMDPPGVIRPTCSG